MDQQKRRKREQEKQKRERLVQSKADPFPSQINSPSIHPHFPSLKRSDGQSDELTRMTKNILGPYDACQEAIFESMSRNQQQQMLGTFEATPSTPLHVAGNPFDRQFGRSPERHPPTSSAGASLSTKGTLTSTVTTSSSSSSSLGSSVVHSHHNRHSVAEAPGSGRTDEKSGKPRGSSSHPRSDRSSSSHVSKSSRQSSDARQAQYKKSSKSQAGENQSLGETTTSRPSNVLPVRKKEKSRVRPFKSGGVASPPTGNQQGPTLPKKPAATGSSQDLFRVDSEQGSGTPARSATPVGTEGGATSSHPRTATPPIPPSSSSSSSSKKAPKVKKRHSHHFSLPAAPPPAPPVPPVTTPTNDYSVGALPSAGSSAPQTMRKSSSGQSSGSLSVSSSSQHKHRKQSSSTLHSSTAKKHGNTSSLNAHTSSSEKSGPTAAAAFKTDPTSLDQAPPTSSSAPPTSSSVSGRSGDLTEQADEKQAKKKRKKAKREKERVQMVTNHGGERREKISEKVKIKSEPSEKMETLSRALHSTGSPSRQTLDHNRPKSLSNQSLVSGEGARGPSKAVKMDKLGKPRPSNLTIDACGESTAEESPLDIKDVHSLLKELMSNVSVPSPITPLSTPRRSSLFIFPQTTPLTGISKLENCTEAPPTGPVQQMSESDSSCSSSSESSSESSDSEEENEEGSENQEGQLTEAPLPMEEGEDNASLGWEKVLPGVGDSITPLKITPPHLVANTPQLSSVLPPGFHLPTISPLAPDTPAHAKNSFASLLSSSISPPQSRPAVSSLGGFSTIGGFVLGTNMLGGSLQASETNLSSSHSLDFTSGSAAPSSSGVPIYSQAPSETASTSLLETNTDSLGFSGLPSLLPSSYSSAPGGAVPARPVAGGGASGSESDGEGADSGSESDDESSDGEEDSDSSSSSGEEAEEDGPNTDQQPPLGRLSAPKASVGGNNSISSAPFFSGDDSFSFQGGGFFNDEDFLSRLQAGTDNPEMGVGEETSLSLEPKDDDSLLIGRPAEIDPQPGSGVWRGGADNQPPLQVTVPPTQQEKPVDPAPSDQASFASQPQASAAMATSSSSTTTAMITPSRLATQHSVDSSSGRTGKKRKLERQSSLGVTPTHLQPPACKTPRNSSAAMRRRDSSLSSFSISSDSSSSSSSDSSDEESDAEGSKSHRRHPPNSDRLPSSPQNSASNGSLFSHLPRLQSQQHTANVTLLNRRGSVVAPIRQEELEVGELEMDEMEGEWGESGGDGRVESLWVKISLQKVDFQKEQKPKAKVEPYNVTAPSKPPRRRSTVDSSAHEDLSRLPGGHHGVDHDRSMYSRSRDRDEDHHGHYGRTDFHRDDGRRTYRAGGWERESWTGGRHGARASRSHERDRDHHRNRNWDEYGTYDDSRPRGRSHMSNRNLSAEDCWREATKRKHDADRTRPPGIDKAKAYLESVAYFMRHGEAIEREAQSWDGTQTRNPFRLYMDTITLMKYCRSWASDCKQLVALCMRCVSVLYWRLFQLKQTTAANIQKDLQDFFIPTKSNQKSPYPGSLSPVPSPASVGSTTSTGSGVGGASSLSSAQDPSPSSNVTVSKQIFGKAAEHLTITGYLHQSLELWQQSNLIVEQYRDFFNTLDRRSGCRITQFSPISVVADWIEMGARLVHYRS